MTASRSGRLPKGGSGATPMNATYRASDFRVTAGASFRMVVDVGDWDNSVCINAPGQSGDRGRRTIGDLRRALGGGRVYADAVFARGGGCRGAAGDQADAGLIGRRPDRRRARPAAAVMARVRGTPCFSWKRQRPASTARPRAAASRLAGYGQV
jgi:hypothetical protein